MHDNDNVLPRSKAEAKAIGAEVYFTGKSCKRGHISIRSVRGECIECRSAYYEENKERISLQKKEYRAQNIGAARARNRAHYRKNSSRYVERAQKWKQENPDKYAASIRKSTTKRRSTPGGRLHHSISTNVSRGLNKGAKNGKRAFVMLGYTLHDLMEHLEKQFQPGMSWENYGRWHVDHIVPVSAHNFETADDIDFKKCWALRNMRPLWAEENSRKHAKMLRPFQPSLAIAEVANDNTHTKAIVKEKA